MTISFVSSLSFIQFSGYIKTVADATVYFFTLIIEKIYNVYQKLVYPEAVKDYLIKNAKNFKENAVVIDCAGVKRCVCEECFTIAEANGFTFIGGHPMAGTQFSGYENAKDTMFHNAPFILTPKENEDILTLANAREVLFLLVSVAYPL